MPLPADLIVRDLTPTDGHAVTALIARCEATYRDFAPAGWDPPQADHSHLYAKHWSRGAFDGEDRLIATVAWEQFCDPDGAAEPGIAHVSAVFVDPARWRQGIATALLSHAEQAMRERGYHLARLWTSEGGPARRFYETNGWRHDGRRKWHDRLRLDVVRLEKRLMPHGPTGHQS